MSYKVEYNGSSGLWEIKLMEPYLDDRVICLCHTEVTAKTIAVALGTLGDTDED
jgi:hypothetical protein